MSSPEHCGLIFGAGGTLGRALRDELGRRSWRVVAVAHSDCDLRDEVALREVMLRARPTVVFNAAAYTDVDRAETEPDVAQAVNADGAGAVARAAAAADAAVVHYSTDFVFDGELERPYDERDPPSPRGAYARSKAAGDEKVAAANARHFVLRVGCLYGRGGRNFPSTIVGRLRGGETVRADGDRRGSPTWVREVAQVSAALALTNRHGLYHCTSQGESTWAEFARQAASILGVPESRVVGVPSTSIPYKAPRPRRAILDNRRLREIGLDTMSSWQGALTAFIAEQTQLE
jgi:dTDP-4-dehydrorhamnose reductase